ncbi:MAG: phosphoglucosamine mutase, partial [Quisquiliibacterium sp.]
LLYIIVRDRLRARAVAGVAGTLMSNLALEQALQRQGVDFVRAKVGDRYVLEALQMRGWLYGGESSGHLLCLDCHSTGDATISALQVLAAIRASGAGLTRLCADLQLLPQKLVNIRISPGFDWQNHQALRAETEAAQAELGQTGRILIRPSGTEPLLRVMVEAGDAALADQIANRLAASVS